MTMRPPRKPWYPGASRARHCCRRPTRCGAPSKSSGGVRRPHFSMPWPGRRRRGGTPAGSIPVARTGGDGGVVGPPLPPPLAWKLLRTSCPGTRQMLQRLGVVRGGDQPSGRLTRRRRGANNAARRHRPRSPKKAHATDAIVAMVRSAAPGSAMAAAAVPQGGSSTAGLQSRTCAPTRGTGLEPKWLRQGGDVERHIASRASCIRPSQPRLLGLRAAARPRRIREAHKHRTRKAAAGRRRDPRMILS